MRNFIYKHLIGRLVVSSIILSAIAIANATEQSVDSPTVSAPLAKAAVETATDEARIQQAALDTDLTLDQQLQAIKKEALTLNRDLFLLKEELQFPANTQVAVFLSVDVGNFFDLDAVNVQLNGKVVANHLYTEKQLDALKRGGIQKLHLGNLKSGEHELVAVFTGRGPKGRDYRRATSHNFSKSSSAKYLEIKVVDSAKLNQPEFSVKDWG